MFFFFYCTASLIAFQARGFKTIDKKSRLWNTTTQPGTSSTLIIIIIKWNKLVASPGNISVSYDNADASPTIWFQTGRNGNENIKQLKRSAPAVVPGLQSLKQFIAYLHVNILIFNFNSKTWQESSELRSHVPFTFHPCSGPVPFPFP